MKVEKQRVTIYTPESLLSSPASLAREMYNDLCAGQELSWRLAIRDISAQYRQTLLGFIWAILVPLSNTIIWIFLSKSGVVSVDKTDIPYPVYVFVGTMLWGILIDAVNAPLQSTFSAKTMLSKINFPRESLIVSGIYKTLFNSVIKLALIVIGIIYYGVYPGVYGLLIPIGIISLILVGTTIGLLITPIGMLYGDVGKAIPILMQFFMYLSPVVYPMPKTGIASIIFAANPITPLINITRSFITNGAIESVQYYVIINIVATIMLIIVWVIYRLSMPILIERISS